MRILALDVGSKRIGLACSDELGFIAQPLPPLHRTNIKEDTKQLKAVIDSFHITEIIVGYPILLNGSAGPQAHYVTEFIDKIKGKLALPIHLRDERLSSVAADKIMIEEDLSRRKRKKKIDSLAAQWILQGYLESKRTK